MNILLLFQEMFTIHAEKYQPHTWFYAMSHEVVKNDLKPPNESAVFVYKEDDVYFFDGKLLPNGHVTRLIQLLHKIT